MKRKILFGIAFAITFIIGITIGAASGGSSSNTNPQTITSTIAGPSITQTVTASPSPTPTPTISTNQTLISHSGTNENWKSTPFNVPSSLKVTYTYSNCPDGEGNFIVDLNTSGVSESDGGYEDINVANAIDGGGSNSTEEYPQNPGSPYYLSVQTECKYSIKVING